MREIEEPFTGYKLMTSVSIPVYNKKNHTVSREPILQKAIGNVVNSNFVNFSADYWGSGS